MQAQVINKFGEPSVFETVDIPVPTVKSGYVLIRVVATSVNPVDTKIRSGVFAQSAPAFPAILHGDVAGIIEKVGADVTEFKVGDEVFGCAGGVKGEGGALAEFMLADARLIAKKPESITLTQAAALPLVSITAWEGLFDKFKLQPGQKVLVHGGMGGVGHVALQLAKYAAADVYTTVSSLKNMALLKSFGASGAINYKEEAVADYVNRLTLGKGFDVVFDTVGGDNLAKSMAAVAQYGHVVTIQARSTQDLSPLHAKSASLHVVFMLIPLLQNVHRERHGKILTQIAHLVDKDLLVPLLDPTQFSFAEVGKAHALVESGKAQGKVVITREKV